MRIGKRAQQRIVTSAFLKAMDEHGIPPHIKGECPQPGCRCQELAGQIEDRAIQIVAGALGVREETLR